MFDNVMGGPKIIKIVCGGMHTVALSTEGKVYTWGCNDDKALGREGKENEPLEVIIGTQGAPFNNITAGDSHSIAYSTITN
jgi:regulator of chromosome condensation